ncbi:nucleoside diphosphate kinase homolog 5 [Eucyclogobius newberryi]|uniref:nucleoside diphosphate kinase homolog 5 n=1 Tax=Eucyclogobius newberryi TaxID=166745 RepID=UPI003B5CB880
MGTNAEDRVYVERTLALIKPDALHSARDIEDVILHSGFTIVQKRKVQLSPEQCSDFYANQYGKPTFSSLTTFMSSGPTLAYTLSRENAISHWKFIMGPTSFAKAREIQPESLRAKYGTSDLQNAVHGSESFTDAEREIKFIFPNTVIEPFPSKEKTEEYLSKRVNPTLLMGLTELCKQKPADPCMWLADWLIANNPNQPQIMW